MNIKFDEKMIKITEKIKSVKELPKQLVLMQGMIKIASVQYLREFDALLEKYELSDDLKKWKDSADKILETCDSYELDLKSNKVILYYKDKNIEKNFIAISTYTDKMDFDHEWEKFLIISYLSSPEVNINFQIVNGIEISS